MLSVHYLPINVQYSCHFKNCNYWVQSFLNDLKISSIFVVYLENMNFKEFSFSLFPFLSQSDQGIRQFQNKNILYF